MSADEKVNHPSHYGGKDNPLEVIKIIRHYKLGFSLGNAIKYILRCGNKVGVTDIEDLEKAKWYIQEEIDHRKSKLGFPKMDIEKITTESTKRMMPRCSKVSVNPGYACTREEGHEGLCDMKYKNHTYPQTNQFG